MSSSVDMSGVPQSQVPNSASSTASHTLPNASGRESMGISIEHTSTRFVWFVSALQCIVSFQNGYNTTIVSGAMGPLSDHYGIGSMEATSSQALDNGNSVLKSIVVSTTLVGALISALAAGAIADRVGRNKVVLAAEAIYIIGTASVVVPLMIGELSPKSIRGQIGVLNQLSITIGILVAYVVGAVFLYIPRVNWRVI
eukprot:m51a1_g6169 hypothetical protein (198) ;mRNA; f:358010-359122